MNLTRIVFIAVLAAFTLPVHAGWFDSWQPQQPAYTPLYVRAGAANIRSAPTTDSYSSVFGTFSQNTPLQVVHAQNFGSEGTWYFVRSRDGREGWVNAHLLSRNITPKVPATKPAPPTQAANPKPEPAQKPAAPAVLPEVKKQECTSNFSKAAEFFRDTQKGADLNSLGEFSGKFGKVSPTFQLQKSGNSILLNMQLPIASVNVNVPITVCKTPTGGLFVNVDNAKARDATSKQPDPTVQQALQSNTIPKSLKINVQRTGNQLVFSGKSGSDTFSASAAVR